MSSAPPAAQQQQPLPHGDQHIALLGLGAIGISFLALHLTHTAATCSVYDPRPDLREHLESLLPLYLPGSSSSSAPTPADNDTTTTTAQPNTTTTTTTTTTPDYRIQHLLESGRLRLCTSLASAVESATIVQESGPENVAFKRALWADVARHAPASAHLWSSTSGIPASDQVVIDADTDADTTDNTDTDTITADTTSSARTDSVRSRLLVLHPFNPPHIMPVLEIIPSPTTTAAAVSFAHAYFASARGMPHRPVPLRREVLGFVANRLSFLVLREAISLVVAGVCGVRELDEIVRASLGVRWAVGGVFEMYNFGGGKRGMEGFLDIIGGAIRGVWEDDRVEQVRWEGGEGWRHTIAELCREAYGVPGDKEIRRRDRLLREVVRLQEEADVEVD